MVNSMFEHLDFTISKDSLFRAKRIRLQFLVANSYAKASPIPLEASVIRITLRLFYSYFFPENKKSLSSFYKLNKLSNLIMDIKIISL